MAFGMHQWLTAVRRRRRSWLWSVVVATIATTVAVGTTVVNAATDDMAPARFTDSFDGAVDGDATYGLNDSLADRQRGEQRGVTYTRVSGVWYSAPPPRPWYSQVNHQAQRG